MVHGPLGHDHENPDAKDGLAHKLHIKREAHDSSISLNVSPASFIMSMTRVFLSSRVMTAPQMQLG
jgi:hypothetical protein